MTKRKRSMAGPFAGAPLPGWCTDAVIEFVKDCDTVRIHVWRELDIRQLDCWAYETHKTKVAGEKAKGLEGLAFARDLLARESPEATRTVTGHPVRVFIPASQRGRLSDILTMGRFLGQVWLPSGRRLEAEIVEAEYAAETREAEQDMLERLRENQQP